jgi:hypothetical protein
LVLGSKGWVAYTLSVDRKRRLIDAQWFLSAVKGRFVSKERRPRRVVSGPHKGLVMQLGFAKELQMYLGLYERETHGWIKRLSRGIGTGIGRPGTCGRNFHRIVRG